MIADYLQKLRYTMDVADYDKRNALEFGYIDNIAYFQNIFDVAWQKRQDLWHHFATSNKENTQ